jgi:hypothetical protein
MSQAKPRAMLNSELRILNGEALRADHSKSKTQNPPLLTNAITVAESLAADHEAKARGHLATASFAERAVDGADHRARAAACNHHAACLRIDITAAAQSPAALDERIEAMIEKLKTQDATNAANGHTDTTFNDGQRAGLRALQAAIANAATTPNAQRPTSNAQ